MYERFQKRKRRLSGGAAAGLLALFLIPLFAVPVLAAGGASAPASLIPVGRTVGVKLLARGVVVSDLPAGATPARRGGLEEGDVIVHCADAAVTSTEQFQTLLQTCGGDALELQVRRGGSVKTLTVTPKTNEQGAYAIGAWIRDSMAGIGTMTFYDPASGIFGALGHGIADVDTAVLMPFASGSILPSTVKAVKRGAPGEAGELRGNFVLTETLGVLSANTDSGVFGTVSDEDFPTGLGAALPVAAREEIVSGPAVILSNVERDLVREYTVELQCLSPAGGDRRELLLTVTDPELLEATGGIVQGMSGSPILQRGKLVGAVTHVLLNDPTRGYGISVETMLRAAKAA